ncbi:MAG: ATP-binding protein [Bacteroidetes bacterium]|nr:ATP-binding protein [Bacteroidota bacterium]
METNRYFKTSLNLLEDLANIQNFFGNLMHERNVTDEICKIIHLIIDEVCVNVFSYNNFVDVKLDIYVTISETEINILFVDNGVQFNPIEYDEYKQVNLPVEERDIGGLGIYLIKHLADKLEYKYCDNKNQFIFIKKM